jgi:hypothetical protein
MNPDEYKQHLIDEFRSGKTSAVEFSKERFKMCFPTRESWMEFIKINHLHLHINPAEWGERVTISVDEANPWG